MIIGDASIFIEFWGLVISLLDILKSSKSLKTSAESYLLLARAKLISLTSFDVLTIQALLI